MQVTLSSDRTWINDLTIKRRINLPDLQKCLSTVANKLQRAWLSLMVPLPRTSARSEPLKSLPQEIVCHSSAAGHRLLSSSSANSWQHWLTTLLWLALSNRHVLHLKCFETYNTRVACGLNLLQTNQLLFDFVTYQFILDIDMMHTKSKVWLEDPSFFFFFLNKWMALLLQRTNINMFLQM